MIAAILNKLAALFGQQRPSTPVNSEPTKTASYRVHIPRSLMYELRDVTRPRAGRPEPLAFLRVRFASEASRNVLVALSALQFPGAAYVAGPAGANFSTEWAVDTANSEIRDNIGLLLVHSHGGDGFPGFSSIDRRTNRSVMGALGIGINTVPYGAIVLSDTNSCCVVAVGGAMIAAKVVVVPDRFCDVRISS